MQLKYLLFLYLLEIEGLQGVRVKPDSQIILMDVVLVNVSQYAATVMIVRVLQAKLSASENLFCRHRGQLKHFTISDVFVTGNILLFCYFTEYRRKCSRRCDRIIDTELWELRTEILVITFCDTHIS